MSLKKALAKVLLFGMLEVGVLCGAPITAEEIENLLELMNRTEIVQMVDREKPND